MIQVKTRPKQTQLHPKVQFEIKRLTKNFSVAKRAEVLKASRVMNNLSNSEMNAAFRFLNKQNDKGVLNYKWLLNFLKILSKLKS